MAALPPERPNSLTASETLALNDLYSSMLEAVEIMDNCEYPDHSDFHVRCLIGHMRMFDDVVSGNCRLIQ